MKELDRLEKFVIDNRDHFDELKPSPESWNKISAHLDQNVDKERSPGVYWILRRAAAAVIIVFAMYGAYNVAIKVAQKSSASNNEKVIDPALKEFAEAEAFYVSRVGDKVAELELLAGKHPEVIHELKEEFDILDADMKALKQDLDEGVARQEIIEAMVQNYRLKLRILENMLEQLSHTNKNESSYEEQKVSI